MTSRAPGDTTPTRDSSVRTCRRRYRFARCLTDVLRRRLPAALVGSGRETERGTHVLAAFLGRRARWSSPPRHLSNTPRRWHATHGAFGFSRTDEPTFGSSFERLPATVGDFPKTRVSSSVDLRLTTERHPLRALLRAAHRMDLANVRAWTSGQTRHGIRVERLAALARRVEEPAPLFRNPKPRPDERSIRYRSTEKGAGPLARRLSFSTAVPQRFLRSMQARR